MKLVRNTDQIYMLLEACADAHDTNTTEFSSLTYEEGIEAAVRWLTEKESEYPLARDVAEETLYGEEEEEEDEDEDWYEDDD